MSNHFKDNPDVFFDLYNEPQLPPRAFGPNGSWSDVWNVWQKGGTALTTLDLENGSNPVGTTNTNYIGMQSLVDTIRGEGANNIIIAEGPDWDQDLSQLPSHYLNGSNIAYGVEPNLHSDQIAGGNDRTAQDQYIRFGQFDKTVPIVPEAFLDNYGTSACDPNSPQDLPELLSYLKSLNMGLTFWSLTPGAAIVGTNLNDPSSYPSGATSIASSQCPLRGGSKNLSNTNTIGDGADIQAYYKANSDKL
jgi:hypothetical protein